MNKKRKKYLSFIFLAILVLAVFPLVGWAMVVKSGENIVVAENMDGNFFGAGNLIVIEKTINGDVFVAGNTINIKGTINGDVFAGGNNVNVSGLIKGSLRAAGSNINVSGRVERNILSMASNLIVDEGAFIGGHITYTGASLILQAPVSGQIDAALQSAVINSSIGGDVTLTMGNKESHLSLLDKAVLSRNLNYKAASKAEIKNGAKILGKTNFTPIETSKLGEGRIIAIFKKFILVVGIFSFLGLFLMGLILIYFAPKIMDKTYAIIKEKPWSNAGIGLVAFIATPILGVLLLITIIGIPLSLMIILGFLAALYFSKAIAAIALGRLIIERFNWHWHKILSLLLGLVILALIGMTPFIGWLVGFLAVILVFGAFLRIKLQILREWR